MRESADGEVTRILRVLATEQGDQGAAPERRFKVAYQELRGPAATFLKNERPDHTPQSTALVSEGYLRLVGGAPVERQRGAHFFGTIAAAMRRVLVELARRRSAEKCVGGRETVALDDNLDPAGRSELERALTQFAEVDGRAARVVEPRVFGGLKEREVAEILGVSERTVRGDRRVAAMWLSREPRGRSKP